MGGREFTGAGMAISLYLELCPSQRHRHDAVPWLSRMEPESRTSQPWVQYLLQGNSKLAQRFFIHVSAGVMCA
eukprot:m.256769 g.256769  ORF g.256769 m.256769 type:complete len:73 (+) comp19632_c0_seq27:809-1027(+)